MNDKKEMSIIPVGDLHGLVYLIRGYYVMLDADLALLYGYTVKRINEQAKRNSERFPEDFMFQLTDEEIGSVWSQNATANINSKSRTNPFVYTEQGTYMLATVLKNDKAVAQSIAIMRAFREMRHFIRQNQQFVTKNELKLIVDRQDTFESEINDIHESINRINENFVLNTELKNFVIYKGQKFEADKAYIEIYRKAKKTIFVIDDYVNIKTLHLLSHKKSGVSVIMFTQNGHGQRGFLTASEVTDFNNEYPTLTIKPNPDCHDRFIILDYGRKEEKVYHCGASSKDAGNKVCAINAIENTALIHPIIDKLILGADVLL
ncbi:MAG: ORF6N domain-containing protein [Lachnospiraceae bacterium]|nr:ORF6N domain-containing protein [Lachnospiraceae bacterium]